MEGIRQYILSIIAVAIICAIAKKTVGKESKIASVINLICGVSIAVTALSPWISFDSFHMDTYFESFSADGQMLTEAGEEAAKESMAAIITDQTQAYILDKAESLGMCVSVEVDLDADSQTPAFVIIKGDVSPYGKRILSQYIENTLAIPEESQTWM